MSLSSVRVAVGAAGVLLAAVACSEPVGEPDAPVVPPSVSAVATGGYWEAGQQHGVVRVVVVQVGSEEVSSRVFLEWLEELPSGGLRVHRRAALDALGDGVGWSVDTPRLRPTDEGLIVELPARHAYAEEGREFRVLVGEPGDFVVERAD
jgi:hypothetical protein